MKRMFKARLRRNYPSAYECEAPMSEVASCIKQRRVRIRRQMKENGTPDLTLSQHGLTKESWKCIWESLSNKQYVEKGNKCKVAVDARTRRMK